MTDIFHFDTPETPTRLYTEFMQKETEERRAFLGDSEQLDEETGAAEVLRDALSSAILHLNNEIISLSHTIHSHPETGFNEYFAMNTVAEVLARHGISSEKGVFDIPTALRASIGNSDPDAPVFALTCEYDALPGIGHGCGHNVMCAQTVGAFLALSALNSELPDGLPMRVILQTTPAEECSTCKEVLFQRGAFDGVDAVVMAHSYGTDVAHQTWLAQKRLKIQFTGVPSHASSAPFMGRNALDAAVLSLTGIGLLRQQLSPTDRMHAIITNGGDVPNVIPEKTELSMCIRSKYDSGLSNLVERVLNIFRGAALMTGTAVTFIEEANRNEAPVISNKWLLQSWVRSQRRRGRNPLPFGVLSETIAAGTDFGNLSTRIPAIHPLVSVGDSQLMLHTEELAAAAASPSGDQAALDGAFGLASVALDFGYDERFRNAVAEDFNATKEL